MSGCCHHHHHCNSSWYARKSKVNNFALGGITWQMQHFALHKQITSSQSISLLLSLYHHGRNAAYLQMQTASLIKHHLWQLCRYGAFTSSSHCLLCFQELSTTEAKGKWKRNKQSTAVPQDMLPASSNFWLRASWATARPLCSIASGGCSSHELS